jgi:replicative DNA helicase
MSQSVEYDLANERVILATMAQSAESRRQLAHDLRADEFGDPRHQIAFRALAEMAKRNLEWNEDTFHDLSNGGDYGGFKYFRKVLDNYDSNENLDHHVNRLRLDSAKLAVLKDDLPEISEACADPGAPSERLLSLARSVVNRFEGIAGHNVWGGDQLIEDYYSTLSHRRKRGTIKEKIGTGPLLDAALVRGFVIGRTSVIAGRPGHGKTTFVSNMIRARARLNLGTFVCGWEMEREDYLDMIVSAETGITASRLAEAESLSKEECRTVYRVTEVYREERLLEIEEYPFAKLAKPKSRWDVNERNLDHFEGTVARAASKGKSLIVIDVVGKMLHDRRPDAIAEMLIRVGQIAKRYMVHICMLHHLNREGASGPPRLETLKGAGSFEEDADVVLGLDRPILRVSAAKRRKMPDVLDVHILKQRKGPAPLCIRYKFDGSRYRISDETEIDLAMLEDEEDGEEA